MRGKRLIALNLNLFDYVVVFFFYIVENTINKCMRKKMRIKWKPTKLSQKKRKKKREKDNF